MARLLADENFPLPVVAELRNLGHDVLLRIMWSASCLSTSRPGNISARFGVAMLVFSTVRVLSAKDSALLEWSRPRTIVRTEDRYEEQARSFTPRCVYEEAFKAGDLRRGIPSQVEEYHRVEKTASCRASSQKSALKDTCRPATSPPIKTPSPGSFESSRSCAAAARSSRTQAATNFSIQ